MADDFDRFLPARFGTGQGKSLERMMFEKVGNPLSQQTVEHLHPDGATTRLRTHAGMLRFVHYGVDEEEEEVLTHISDLMSGFVIGGYFDPENSTLAGVLRTTPFSAVATGMHLGALWKTNRLAVPLSGYITKPVEISDADGPTQYSVVQPYKYTGRMRALVQFLLGIGRTQETSRYDELLTLPTTCIPTMENGTNVQIHYNYRFDQSHGLHSGADGTPWTIMIDQALGVWAFILPRIHGSELASFQTAMIDADLSAADELMVAWPMFKGIPTGESMTPETLSAWEKSGCAIKLLDVSAMGVYAESQGVASQLGWAFNYTGNEARVIAIKPVTGPDTNYKTAHYLSVSFSMGAVRAPLSTSAIEAVKARYIVEGAPAHVRLKAHYMRDVDAYNVLNGTVAFNDLVSPPVASFTASFSELETSVYFAPSSEVKVWDDNIGFCMSLGMESRTNAPAGITSTPLHVFYDKNNTLRELRIRAASGDTSSGPYMTSVFDTTGQSNGSTTVVNASDTRYTGLSEHRIFSQPSTDLPDAWLRFWWSTKTDTIETKPGHSTMGVAFVPCGDRESVIFAKKHTHEVGSKQYDYTFNATNADKIAYDLFDNFIIGENRNGTVRLISGCWLSDLDFGGFIDGVSPIDEVFSNDANPAGDGEWADACARPYQATYPNPDAALVDHVDVVPSRGEFEVQAFIDAELRLIQSDTGGRLEIDAAYGAWFASSTPILEDQQTMRTTCNAWGTHFVQCYDDINSGHYKIFGTLPMPNAEEEDYQLNYIGLVQ